MRCIRPHVRTLNHPLQCFTGRRVDTSNHDLRTWWAVPWKITENHPARLHTSPAQGRHSCCLVLRAHNWGSRSILFFFGRLTIPPNISLRSPRKRCRTLIQQCEQVFKGSGHDSSSPPSVRSGRLAASLVANSNHDSLTSCSLRPRVRAMKRQPYRPDRHTARSN